MTEKETTLETGDGDMTTFIVHPDGPDARPVAAQPQLTRVPALGR